MRICLDKKILRVSDFPNYSNVCEIEDVNKIYPDVFYRFAIESWRASARISIMEIKIVNNFDDKMWSNIIQINW